MPLSDYAYWNLGAVNATTAGAQTDYQLELIVGESSGASGCDVHCNNHCQDFPNDIQFTKEDSETKHDYWVDTNSLEGSYPNRKVSVWIEVASIPASGSVDFYMYYGKSGDEGESNCSNTFLFGNDFKRADKPELYFEDFLDTYNKESSTNIGYSVHKPTKYANNPVFSGGSWDEDKYYVHVDYIDSKYKMWYGAVDTSANLHACYAESINGYSWTRPTLGLINYGGNTNNNILLPEDIYAPSIYYDPNASNPDRKYILQSPGERGKPSGSNQHVYFSPDGKNFTFGKVIYGPNPDSTGHMEATAIQKLEDGSDRWISYYQRYWSGPALRATGAQISETSDPMGEWQNFGVLIPELDVNDQMYSNGVSYKDGRYYSFVTRYNKSTENVELSLWVSRNGLTWLQVDPLWIPRGGSGDWDESMVFDGETLVNVGDEWWFYYTGSKYNHAHSLPRQSHIGIAKIDYRRIGSIYAETGVCEDFTTFTEVDVGADRIQKTAHHIDHLAHRNENTYLYKDYGAAYFDDFTHKIKIKLAGGGDAYNINICWGLANTLNNAYAVETGGNTQVILYLSEVANSILNITLRESYSSTGYYDINTDGFDIGNWIYAKIVKSGTSLTAYLYSDENYSVLVDTLTLTLQANHSFRYLYAANTWNTGATYQAPSDIENFDIGEVGTGSEGNFISKNLFTLNSLEINCNASGGGTMELELLDTNGDPIVGYRKADFDTITTDGHDFTPAWSGITELPAQPVKLKFYLKDASLYSYLADCSNIHYIDDIENLGNDLIEQPDKSNIQADQMLMTEGGENNEWYLRKLRHVLADFSDNVMLEAKMQTNVTNSWSYLHFMGADLKHWHLAFSPTAELCYLNAAGGTKFDSYTPNESRKFSILFHNTANTVDYYVDDVLIASDQSGYLRDSWRILKGEVSLGTHYSIPQTLKADWVYVRKHVSPEPILGAWSGEQSSPEQVLKMGLFYGKLGNTILETVVPESFRITHEINKIPSFEFEVANSEANRTAIAANPTALFKIYWQHHGVETHIFTGIINADGIEYISLTNIRITGFSSYAKLGWPLFKHLSSEDAEEVNTVLDYSLPLIADFMTFTEVDIGSDRIQKTSHHVDHYACRGEATYLYKDYGVDYFSDFTHRIKIRTETLPIANHGAFWMLSDGVGDILSQLDPKCVLLYPDLSNFYLESWYLGDNITDMYAPLIANTWYYIEIKKIGTNMSAKIYTNPDYTNLVDTLSITLQDNFKYRYLYACNTMDSYSGNCANHDIDDLRLNTGAGYTNYTTAANNDTINDVIGTFKNVNDCLYVGEANPFWGLQIKYSTKGVPDNAVTIIEYSKGGSDWAELHVLDETYAFTEDPGIYDVVIAHPPSDWARNTVDGISKFWIRWRVVSGAYSTSPKLDRIHTVNVDVYRVFYLATSARAILLDAINDTEYTMDTIDTCPEDEINLFAEYESPLRVIAALPAALTWTDIDGSKKAYQWWIDDTNKVHIKKKRGTTYSDDITGDLTIFNNLLDYFNISNRLIGFGKRDGLSQIRAIVEDRASQTTHALREFAVPKTDLGKYITLKEGLEKDITLSKNPMQRIKGSVTTEFWGKHGYEVGDTVTLHQSEWVVEEGEFQIVKVDRGPITTQLNLGISREHLEGLKSNLKRAFDISNVQMHGSTSLLTAGPETSNYERKSDGSVFASKLKIEIPSEVIKTHKVLLSWTIGPYRASVNENSNDVPPHDHGGNALIGGAIDSDFTGEDGGFTPEITLDGGFTPSMLGEAHSHDTNAELTLTFTENIRWFPIASAQWESKVYNTNHRHTTPASWTGAPDTLASAITALDYEKYCGDDGGYCIGYNNTTANFGTANHLHYVSAGNSGYTELTTAHIALIERNTVSGISPYVFSEATDVESPQGHIHTGVAEDDHVHAGVAEGDHLHGTPAVTGHVDHGITTESGYTVGMNYGIHEEAAGTVLELLVNSEKIGEYSGAQTEIRIDGYLQSGSNIIKIQPIAVEINKKGSATIVASGILFIEPKRF